MRQRPSSYIMNNYRSGIVLALAGVCFCAQASIVTGGTRFIFDSRADSLAITLKNTDTAPWLVKSTVNKTLLWSGAVSTQNDNPFVITPPLFALADGRENTIRIIKVVDNLPADRESLYELLITAIPSGKMKNNSVQVALRSRYKLIYRPKDLPGQPEQAYQQIQWQWRQDRSLEINNATPYYVTLTSVRVNAHPENAAGVVAPFTRRSVSWCKSASQCNIQWRTLDDVGKELPAMNAVLKPTP